MLFNALIKGNIVFTSINTFHKSIHRMAVSIDYERREPETNLLRNRTNLFRNRLSKLIVFAIVSLHF